MNFKLVASLSSSVAMLALVFSLIACGGSGEDITDSSATNPEVPSIPVASWSDKEVEGPTNSTDRGESEPERETTATDSQDATESDKSEEVTTVSPSVDDPTDPGALLNAAALRTATTNGAQADISCSVRLTDGNGQTTEAIMTVSWRRVGGNCVQSGDVGYTVVDGTLYVPGVGVKIPGMTDRQMSWLYENMIAPGLLPFDPESVRTLNASERVVTASGVRDQYMSSLLASLQIYADDVTLTESSGSVTLNDDMTLKSAEYRVALTYVAEGDTYRQEFVFDCTYRYDSEETVEIPEGAGSCSSVSFRDVFDIDIPDQTETESSQESSSEEDVRYVTVANLNVRSSPDFSSEKNVVGYLHKGDRIVILQDYGSYARIEYKGKECYIGTRYLSAEKPD